MGDNDTHGECRAESAAGRWLGTVRPLAPGNLASLPCKGFAPATSPGSIALGYFLAGRLRGVAHLLPLKPATRSRAEIRVAIEEGWQRCGIGTLLMGALLQQAHALGIGEVYLRCHALNTPMQRLAEAFGAEIGFEDCQAYGCIRLAEPACVSAAR